MNRPPKMRKVLSSSVKFELCRSPVTQKSHKTDKIAGSDVNMHYYWDGVDPSPPREQKIAHFSQIARNPRSQLLRASRWVYRIPMRD